MKIFYLAISALILQVIVALFVPASNEINAILFSLVLILFAIDLAVDRLKK